MRFMFISKQKKLKPQNTIYGRRTSSQCLKCRNQCEPILSPWIITLVTPSNSIFFLELTSKPQMSSKCHFPKNSIQNTFFSGLFLYTHKQSKYTRKYIGMYFACVTLWKLQKHQFWGYTIMQFDSCLCRSLKAPKQQIRVTWACTWACRSIRTCVDLWNAFKH